jgi:hypothetical protein
MGDVLRDHGEPVGDGRLRVRRSQAALARDAACSPGTIAYYLHELAGAVSVSRDDGLLVDPAAMAPTHARRGRSSEVAALLVEAFGRPADGEWVELVDAGGRAPTVRTMAMALALQPSTTQRHVERLLAAGRLRRSGRRLHIRPDATTLGTDDGAQLRPDIQDATAGSEHRRAAPAADAWSPAADARSPAPAPAPAPALFEVVAELAAALVAVAQDLVRISERLLAAGGQADAVSREPATFRVQPRVNGQSVCAPIAGSRDCAHQFAGSVPSECNEELEEDLSSNCSDQRFARTERDSARAVRGSAVPPFTGRTRPLSTDTEIAAALGPLRELCERLHLPETVDAEGRRWLCLYAPAELRRAVGRVMNMTRGAGQVRSPMGLLVARAKQGEESLFEPVPERTEPLPAVVAEEPAEPVDEEAARAIAAMDDDELAAFDERLEAWLRSRQGGRSVGIDRIMGDPITLARRRQELWRETEASHHDEPAGGHG